MNARSRPAPLFLAAAAVLLVAGAAAGLLGPAASLLDAGGRAPAAAAPSPPPTPAEATPALVAEGQAVFARRCEHCHRDVPLERRVRGWDLARAHDAVGRLDQLTPLMPPFRGTEAERRALAAYLAALGQAH
ncbi:MAG: c-type cytochrome [Anaeromyxobacter sp.]